MSSAACAIPKRKRFISNGFWLARLMRAPVLDSRDEMLRDLRSYRLNLDESTPLWLYVLREAEWYGVARAPADPGLALGGQHLGPVGSRIVAETFIGLLWLDKASFLHDLRTFTPLPQLSGGKSLTLARLVEYALT